MTGLVGREAEVARVERLLDGARAGRAGALALLGDAGIGKSSLLDAAEQAARERGLVVLRSRAVPAERDIPFAALSELLVPVLDRRDELAPGDAAALDGALGFAASARRMPEVIADALLALLRAVAREGGGVALLVDDAHWLDDESLATLRAAFGGGGAGAGSDGAGGFGASADGGAGGRAGGTGAPAAGAADTAQPIALLLAARPLPERGLRDGDLPLLELTPLSPDAAEELLRRLRGEVAAADGAAAGDAPAGGGGRAGDDAVASGAATAGGGAAGDARRDGVPPLAATTRRRLLSATAGNPLALVESLRLLTPAQAEGSEPLAEPPAASEAIQRSFRAQLDALPTPTRAALLVLAADERLSRTRIAAVLARLDLPADALAPALRDGLLNDDGPRVSFRHPLLRATAYHAPIFAERAAAHRAIAEVLAEGATDAKDAAIRAAWHLAAAATGPDEVVATALARAATAARERGGRLSAAHALQRAAELTPLAAARARRLLGAADDFAAGGRPGQALALVARALADDDGADPLLAADADAIRSHIALFGARLDDSAAIGVAAARRVADTDPGRAVELLTSAALRHLAACDYGTMAELVAQARALADRASAPEADRRRGQADLLAAILDANLGRIGAAGALLERHRTLLLEEVPAGVMLELFGVAAHVAGALERFELADEVLETLVARGRAQQAAAWLTYPLLARGELAYRRGRLSAAAADGEEALRLAREAGQPLLIALAGGMLAQTDAALGRTDDCQRHAAEAIAICDGAGAEGTSLWARAALGLQALDRGRPEEALTPLAACSRIADRLGMHGRDLIQWQAAHTEALARLGRRAEADAALARLEAGERTAWARGSAARCRALLADGEEAVAHYEQAIDAFEQAGLGYEAARAQLALGALHRRDGRRRRAEPPLRAALVRFERAGASGWVERARTELSALGDGPDQLQRVAPFDELTAQEWRIATLVGDGRRNDEIARELTVSRKTVEHHLSAIYRKLDLRSRTALVGLLNAAADRRG